MNPFSARPLLPVFTVQAMDIKEPYAEIVRAALIRKEPVIRDFFDLLYGIDKMKIDIDDHDSLFMIKEKPNLTGNNPAEISSEYKRKFDRQDHIRLTDHGAAPTCYMSLKIFCLSQFTQCCPEHPIEFRQNGHLGR